MAKTTTKTTENSKNGAFLNHYPKGMVHIKDYTTKKGKAAQFASVSINCPQSKSGIATIAVSMGQLLPATKTDNGTVEPYVVENRYNILLGDADDLRDVSVQTNNAKVKKNKKFATIQLTNAAIAEMVNAARAEYVAADAANA